VSKAGIGTNPEDFVACFLTDGGGDNEMAVDGIAALANGVNVKCNNHNLAIWRDNVDIMTCMYDVEGRAIFAKATKSMSARWTFTKATLKGDPLICERKHGFQIVINDNISGLTSFKIAVQGQARLINSR
jgi:hypothetical protein